MQYGGKPILYAPSRVRTYDFAVNSRTLYQLSYKSLIAVTCFDHVSPG